MQLDEFLEAQGEDAGPTGDFKATLETVEDKPDLVKVTPYVEGLGCGCAGALELPKTLIRHVTPSGSFHLCCGKRLEVVSVEFVEGASVPVAEVLGRAMQPAAAHRHAHEQAGWPAGGWPGAMGPMGYPPRTAQARRGPAGGAGIVGRWPIPWTPCHIECAEVCVEFCSDVGWDCCKWETRCGFDCDGFIA
jgi:hypothetical protein